MKAAIQMNAIHTSHETTVPYCGIVSILSENRIIFNRGPHLPYHMLNRIKQLINNTALPIRAPVILPFTDTLAFNHGISVWQEYEVTKASISSLINSHIIKKRRNPYFVYRTNSL
jgi:hypothetical protein